MNLSFDQSRFLSDFPDAWKDIFPQLKALSYVPILVGGTVRDFLLTGSLGADWDIELRHPTHAFSHDEWKNLGKQLSNFGKVSYLPYEVIRLESKGVQFEFSPPRKEVFALDWSQSGHSNFTAEFNFNLPFELSVLRRDFTLNAMGVKFVSLKEVEFLDPLGGLIHLQDKCLHPCGSDFGKDPVRFLRALRFSLKFGLQFTKELEDILKSMPISSLSSVYIWNEMQKSARPIKMLEQLCLWQEVKPEIALPLTLKEPNLDWDELGRVLIDPTKHEVWIIALEWMGIPSEKWQRFFSLSAEICSRLSRWSAMSKKFISLSPEYFQGEFESVSKLPDFEMLFDWYFTTKQLLQKNSSLPLLKLIEAFLPSWVHLFRFEAVKDVKHIDPPLRAKYQVWNLCQRI
jgi:tRNA nucleotidyltransferase/poly(A) polymerase